MSKVKVELNKQGVRDLLLSNEVGQFCKEQAMKIASRDGNAEVGDIYRGKNRVNVSVISNSNSNNLLRSLR